MIITAFTIAKNLAEAKELGIKRFYGDEHDCGANVRYASNNNCVSCSAKRKLKSHQKIPNMFFCKQHQEYFDMSLLGEKTRYYALCKVCKESRDNHDAARRAARQKPAPLRTKVAP